MKQYEDDDVKAVVPGTLDIWLIKNGGGFVVVTVDEQEHMRLTQLMRTQK